MKPPRHEGTLTSWNEPNGLGVITTQGGGAAVPVYRDAFPSDGYLPTLGEVLTFELEPGSEGHPIAVRVQRFAHPATEVARAGNKGRKLRLSKAPRQAGASSAPSKAVQRLAVIVLIVLLALVAYIRYAKRVGFHC